MTNELIEKYVDALMDEQEAFNDYKAILQHEMDTETRTTIIGIASDEVRHYELIHKIIFKDMPKTLSVIEHSFMNISAQKLKEMKECLMELKR